MVFMAMPTCSLLVGVCFFFSPASLHVRMLQSSAASPELLCHLPAAPAGRRSAAASPHRSMRDVMCKPR